MRSIMPDFKDLNQYCEAININLFTPDLSRPKFCPNPECGSSKKLYYHGFYTRKPDRENLGEANLNPVIIYRFMCPACRRTCSVLPACIPPRRWYQWRIQQAALLAVLAGESYRKVASRLVPSRQTIRRWLKELKDRHMIFSSVLRSHFPCLGKMANSFSGFWRTCLEKIGLIDSMLYLNCEEVIVP